MLCGHDIIYRRTRNELLQKILGVTLKDFKRQATPVKYRASLGTNAKFHSIAEEAGQVFELSDGEVLIGQWANDVDIIYETDNRLHHPMVTARTYGKGRVVWTNSGDTHDHPPKSIAKPQEEYVKLLTAAIKWLMSTD